MNNVFFSFWWKFKLQGGLGHYPIPWLGENWTTLVTVSPNYIGWRRNNFPQGTWSTITKICAEFESQKYSYFNKICSVTTSNQLSYNQKQINLTFLLAWISLWWIIFSKQKSLLTHFKFSFEKEKLNKTRAENSSLLLPHCLFELFLPALSWTNSWLDPMSLSGTLW